LPFCLARQTRITNDELNPVLVCQSYKFLEASLGNSEAFFSFAPQLDLTANSVHDQEASADQTAQTDHGVTDPKSQSIVGRLKGRQEAEPTECSDDQKERRAENCDNRFHSVHRIKRNRRRSNPVWSWTFSSIGSNPCFA